MRWEWGRVGSDLLFLVESGNEISPTDPTGIQEQEGVLECLDHWDLDLMKMGVIAKGVVWPLGTKMDCSRDKRGNKMPCWISVALVFLKLL